MDPVDPQETIPTSLRSNEFSVRAVAAICYTTGILVVFTFRVSALRTTNLNETNSLVK